MRHFNVVFEPDGKQVSIHEGATLLEAAGQAGIVLNATCGGKGICKKCALRLKPEDREVLACQYTVHKNLTVTVPSASRFFEHKILQHGIDTKSAVIPSVYKRYRKKDSTEQVYGLAVDIGTTTVVAKLINMVTGQSLDTEATLNPQSRFGDDVISRITYAQTEARLHELQKIVIDCINELIDRLCVQASILPEQIYEVCAVGNTTMNHILLKFPVEQLGHSPYKAFSLDAHDVSATDFGLRINPSGNLHTVENIAGFVGSDTTAVALAVDIDSADDVTLVIDIGTNGELIFAAKDNLYAASCAAGPAFEGARITCGSRAVKGAIEAVVINEDDIDIDVIADAAPHSICGSGLIDVVAVLLNLGIVEPSGRFLEPGKIQHKLPESILSRITQKNGQLIFCLSYDQITGQPGVFLTQKDIREIQLAKAAIRAGITFLLKKTNLKDFDIDRILLAGAFGNYIRPQSALRIGLLPTGPIERIHFVGNAASIGAQMVLLSQKYRNKARELARRINYIEIAYEPDFQTVYTNSMSF
jgi:uncharacterized 2Fe-2S/4Fe-4S cluster protein (DUF4445 family)